MKILNSTQIPNYILHVICQGQLSQIETKILLAICRQTIGWHKETDWITFKRFKQLTDLSDSLLSRGIKRLIEKGLIEREGEQGNYYSLTEENEFIKRYDEFVKSTICLEVMIDGFRTKIHRNLGITHERVRKFLTELQENKCFYCDKQFETALVYEGYDDEYSRQDPQYRFVVNVDHFVPIRFGGSDVIENRVISCPACNGKKGIKLPKTFFNEIGKPYKEPPIVALFKEKASLNESQETVLKISHSDVLKVNSTCTNSTSQPSTPIYTKETITKESPSARDERISASKSEEWQYNKNYILENQSKFADSDFIDKEGESTWRYILNKGKCSPAQLFAAVYWQLKEKLSEKHFSYTFKTKNAAWLAYMSESNQASLLANSLKIEDFKKLLEITDSKAFSQRNKEYDFEWKLSTAIKNLSLLHD